MNNTLRRSFLYLKPYWIQQIFSLLVAIILTLLALVQPWVNKLLIDDVLIQGSLVKLKLVCFLFLGTSILQIGLGLLRSWLFSRVGEGAVLDLQNELYSHIQSLSLPFFHARKTGEIMASFTSDVSQMQSLYSSTFVDLVTDCISLVVILTVMFLIDAKLSLIAICCIPLYILSLKVVARPIRRSSKRVQEARAIADGELQERISGVREIKSLMLENLQARMMGTHFLKLMREKIKLTIITSIGGFTTIIGTASFALVIWFGGLDVINNRLHVGVFIAFLGYMGQMFGPVNTFVHINSRIQTAIAAARRVFEILDRKPDIELSTSPVVLDKLRGSVRFENVCFGYRKDGIPVLRNASFEILPGESVAFVGPSGSGKTTIIMLLLRFYDPDSGRILIDGHDLKYLDLGRYRAQMGIVFQDPFLFDTSIRKNIASGIPDMTDARIMAAAESACIDRFIQSLSEHLDTITGERGITLSGGQKQRIAIARALARDPQIVILDEATSALDHESETAVKRAVHALLEGKTSLVIAHRLSTIQDCDRKLSIVDGAVIEMNL
jgi:subfamily B ATP-binding cassette protein MsbA